MGRRRSSDLPTVPPPFNVARFAKDSDAQLAVSPAARSQEDEQPQSETRLATRPRMDAVVTDEGWARSALGILVVAMPVDQLIRMPLDHRAGFLLSWMDGSIDLETLLEASTMPRAEALRIVRDLVQCGIVVLR